MINLFTTASFKKKKSQLPNDVELAMAAQSTDPSTNNLDAFFEEVEAVKVDMDNLENLRKSLQDLNEETHTAHSASNVKELRGRMDKEVENILHNTKAIKTKLEGLEKSNAGSRKIAGCGPGSSTDRTRSAVVHGLGKKLKYLMDDFQLLREKISNEYKETVGRRYYTVTGTLPDDEAIETLISTGESERFLQHAIEEQGRGNVMDMITEIQERHDSVKEIEKNLLDLHQVFLDMAAMVDAQGCELDDIENQVAQASSFVKKGKDNLEVALQTKRNTTKWACLAIFLVVVIIIVILLPLLLKDAKSSK